MPTYDFQCAHGHSFDHFCKMAERNEPIPCQGEVNQVVEGELYDKYIDSDEPLPEGLFWMNLVEEIQAASPTGEVPDGVTIEGGDKVLMRKVPCMLKANMVVRGSHLHHNWGANRDAAKAGTYDPLNPSRRGLSGGKDLNRK